VVTIPVDVGEGDGDELGTEAGVGTSVGEVCGTDVAEAIEATVTVGRAGEVVVTADATAATSRLVLPHAASTRTRLASSSVLRAFIHDLSS
jgi:hypothetical protein